MPASGSTSEATLLAREGRTVTRSDVEDFLIDEALILDQWRLDDWLALFEEGAHFEVMTTDWKGWSADAGGSFVNDDWGLIKARVKRLKSRKAHAENPRSRTHRLIGNVKISSQDGDHLNVEANFVIHRYRDGAAFTYVGSYQHVLAITDSGLKFRHRRAIPVSETMDFGARLSFIL